jgi:hypothetical protein
VGGRFKNCDEIIDIKKTNMKRLIFFFAFCIPLFGYSQTYWNFIMDTCSVWSEPEGTFIKDSKFCSVVQEIGNTGLNTLRIISLDEQLNRQDLITPIATSDAIAGNFKGLTLLENGYLLRSESASYRLIKFDQNLNVEWTQNIADSLDMNIGLPSLWSESTSNDLFGAGVFGYPNSYQCFTYGISLTKLNENGAVIFQQNYPSIFQNSFNGYLYDFAIPRSIEVFNDHVYITGEAAQFYPGSASESRTQTFFAKFDLDGNLISLEFLGDKTAISRVVRYGANYYVVRQELVNEGNAVLSKTKIYFKESFEAVPELRFHNNSVMDEFQKSLWRAIETTEGLLILVDNSDNNSLGAKLIMYDVVTNSVMWQKNYQLNIDSSTVNISSIMNNFQDLLQLPDLGFAFSGSVLINNNVYPWYIRTDACGDEVFNGCTISGVSEMAEATSLKLFPNPAVNEINIQLPTADTWSVRVFNSNGQLVSTENVNQSSFIQLNIQNLNTGLYTVQAMNGAGRVYSEMVVKE